MEEVAPFVTKIIFQLIAIGLLLAIIYHFFLFIYKKPLYTHLYFPLKKLPSHEKPILQNEVEYYKRLPEKKKKYFEHRVAVFLEHHPIIPKENIVVTPQMRVLIASTSVALTFGFQRFLYRSFKAILVYPDIYFSTITEQYHKGEFNPKEKVIVFSWKHFIEGHSITNDNIHLGFHEFAHALHFEMKQEDHPNSHHFIKYFIRLLLEIRRPEKREKLLNTTYIREYAFENKYEFLAVLIENYFETPDIFKQEFPIFYQKLKKMLNQ